MSKALLAILAACLLVACQSSEPPALDPEAPTFDAVIANSQHLPGLLDLYRDETSGDLYLSLRPDQLEKDFLYFGVYLDGNQATDTARGTLTYEDRVMRFRRHFGQLQFLELNTRFYFDADNPLARSADANLKPAVLAVADIVDEDEEGRMLVPVSAIFLTEALQQVKPAVDPEAEPGFALGELSETRTSLDEVFNYPGNTDIVVSYVYEDPAPLVAGGRAITDSRYVGVTLQHTFAAAPETPMQARFEDPRVGYFTSMVTDMTDTSPTPWRDPVQRWRLVKKNPGAALSEPVQPIVFWIENTTPLELRDVVREATLSWNIAFEDAGFKNAIEVRQQPDDADWDARDMRYNVLRWTSSEESAWWGYGPTWVDPRSGEIFAGDVMLEYSIVRYHAARDAVFSEAMLPPGDLSRRHAQCHAGAALQQQMQLGRAFLTAQGWPDAEAELVQQSVFELVLHEVGHVLGLTHNFAGSQLKETDALFQQESLQADSIVGSVMDYSPVNYPEQPVASPRFYQQAPGVYDRWAIEWGYSGALADAEAENARLADIAGRSSEPGLLLGHHYDGMSSSSNGIDPRVMIYDMSSDPIAYSERRMDVIDAATQGLRQRLTRDGESWQAVYNGYLALSSEKAWQSVVASRWIGGVYVDRAVKGQAGADIPLRPVAREQQQRAMAMLREHLFAPEALQFEQDLYQHLQRQRRGDTAAYTPQDPKLHRRVLNAQSRVLSHLLHPVTTSRINDSTLYGNTYPLVEVLEDLTNAIFADDLASSVNSLRQQLQREYVEVLIAVADTDSGSEHDHVTRGLALYALLELQAALASAAPAADQSTRAHRVALAHRIEQGLETDT